MVHCTSAVPASCTAHLCVNSEYSVIPWAPCVRVTSARLSTDHHMSGSSSASPPCSSETCCGMVQSGAECQRGPHCWSNEVIALRSTKDRQDAEDVIVPPAPLIDSSLTTGRQTHRCSSECERLKRPDLT